ncbi:hypothetical protein BJ912DRAFT_880441 [Pholiota molesta]|nr:hypothetical protein BJ912DRAFT_880441 [Pholiota molesta]
MFGGGSSTEYEDIVNKTTDENLTSENWELILNLCDKVQDEGQPGAHAAIAAILKRLAHRNPNVQLYALSLTEALGKNTGIEVHRELASRAFTQGLEKLITDRNTHEKVRRRALGLIALWTAEFEKDETLGIMEDCYNNLKAKNYKFEQPEEAPPPTVDDEIRRKEEEELQRVLEMSMQDRGGRNQWSNYSVAAGSSSSSAAAAASGSKSSAARSNPTPTAQTTAPSGAGSSHYFAAPKYSDGGYVPARTPSPNTVAAQQRQQQQYYQAQLKQHSTSAPSAAPEATPTPAAAPVAAAPAPAVSSSTTPAGPSVTPNMNIVTRVRALHTFEPTEPGELAFEKGDIIKVVDRGYKDWWRGQLKGRTGIFPVNYVEAMPEPTAAELAKEAEQEAAVFAQAVNVEKLLNMLRAMDPAKDNLADNEEIQELYRSSMALRPKIVKLIDKYSQKRADLVSMNETFVRARTIFDRMMEESLARHSGVYDQPTFRNPQYGHPQGRPDSRGAAAALHPQATYGWNAPAPGGYDQQPPAAYGAYPGAQGPPAAYGMHGQPAPEMMGASPYASPGVGPGPGQPGQPGPGQPQGQPGQYPIQQQPIQQQPVQQQQQPQPIPQQQPQVQAQPEPAHAASSPQPQAHPQTHVQPEPQAQPPAQQAPQQPISGPPPYVYNPSYTYADPNVQAWAQYYAQGGKDLAGSVYFISIPGVTDGQAAPQPGTQSPDQQQPQRQQVNSRQSTQTQPQTQAQPQTQQPIENELAYGPVSGIRTTSPVAQQPQQYPTSYQPQDQPAYTTAYQQQPTQADTAPKQASPTQAYGFGQGPARQNSAGSPTQASSTPAWVLPKKTGPSPVHAREGPGATAPVEGSYFPQLANQLGGVTLIDPGSGSAVSG